MVTGWQLCNWHLIPSGVRNSLHQNVQNDYKEHVTSCPVGTKGYPNEGKRHEQKPNHSIPTKLSRSKVVSPLPSMSWWHRDTQFQFYNTELLEQREVKLLACQFVRYLLLWTLKPSGILCRVKYLLFTSWHHVTSHKASTVITTTVRTSHNACLLVKDRMTDRARKMFYLTRMSHAQNIQCQQQIM